MTAADYPVTFPFRATTAPYTPTNPHLGADRAMPIGTAVIVAGTRIGLSGMSGAATGPHTHQAKWKPGNLPGGLYVLKYNATYFDPADVLTTGGTVSQISTVDMSAAGRFVRWQKDGFTREVFHLSQVDVKVGDIIGDDMPELANQGDVENLVEVVYRMKATPDDIKYWMDAINANQLDFKKLFFAMKDSQRYSIEAYINEGDVQHLALHGIDAKNGKDKFWKLGIRDFAKGTGSTPAQQLKPGIYEVS